MYHFCHHLIWLWPAERRKIERSIRRLEKQQRSLADQGQAADNLSAVSQQLAQLKEDLEYVRVRMVSAAWQVLEVAKRF
jgi:hypothetical protein